MKINEYAMERIALYIGWHQSMLIKQCPSHNNINAGLTFLRSNFDSSNDQLIKIGLFESLYTQAGASSAILNEYSARSILINYDQDLYDDYFKMLGAYTTKKAVIQSNNQAIIANVNQGFDLTAAFYILFNISRDDLQDWKWVGGKYPWEYQDHIDPLKKQIMEFITASRTFFHSVKPFHDFYDLPESKSNSDLDTSFLIQNG
ncbi:hypothetical protein N8Z14_02840 [Gammaproteobacteria bacterium]|nr:hypothetical protein [Gammaproteobacteria bacterium]